MSNEIMIRMEQIVKTYYIGQPNELEILHGINLDVKRGEFAVSYTHLTLPTTQTV